MDFDRDRLLLARAILSDLVETLRLTHFASNPVLFLTRLEAIRETAKAQRFGVAAEIAASFEDAMQPVIAGGGGANCWGQNVIENYTEILRDAIGCDRADGAVSEAMLAESMLASVAIRLRA